VTAERNLLRTELPQAREAHSFRRTTCGCDFCKAFCRHLPGALDPSDLLSLCPREDEVFAWAEQHLRAHADSVSPSLVPARGFPGHCHWYFEGQCAVHANAPFGCAFFDAHQSDAEVEERVAATVRACREDAAANGLYFRVWQHLCARGLIARRGDRTALAREMRQIRRAAGRR
jgi:hypothetical protein